MTTQSAYLEHLQSLLPSGQAWPREEGATLTKLLDKIAVEWERIDTRAVKLIEESDPRSTLELFAEWENIAGLPDGCVLDAQSFQERRERLIQKITAKGGQSKAYFIAVAASLGYVITITEYRPFICGGSVCGETLDGPEIHRLYWTVSVSGPRVNLFKTGSARCGESLGTVARAEDLECIFQKLAPSHTQLIFLYEGDNA